MKNFNEFNVITNDKIDDMTEEEILDNIKKLKKFHKLKYVEVIK